MLPCMCHANGSLEDQEECEQWKRGSLEKIIILAVLYTSPAIYTSAKPLTLLTRQLMRGGTH